MNFKNYIDKIDESSFSVPSEMNLSAIVLPSGMLLKELDRSVPVPFAYFVELGHKNQLNPKCNSILLLREVLKCPWTILAVQRFRHVRNSEWLQSVSHIDRSVSNLQ